MIACSNAVFSSQILIAEAANTKTTQKGIVEELTKKKSKTNEVDNKNLDDNYLLGVGDVIKVTFLSSEDLSGEHTILTDNTISLPIVGRVDLSYLSLDSATKKIEKLFEPELIRSDVVLTLLLPRPITVSLLGEVQRPGLYNLSSQEDKSLISNSKISGPPTLIDAIQKAGGIKKTSNLKNVSIMRRLEGKEVNYKRAFFNLSELILEGKIINNPFLFDGDIIKLSRSENNIEDEYEIISANLSPMLIEVNVIGEVKSPGKQQIKSNTPLLNAILQAGGPIEWKANRANVQLFRIQSDGSLFRKKFNINLSKGVSSSKNPVLHSGDIIVVNQSALEKVSKGIGAITQPLTGLVTSLSLFKLINE